MKDLLLILLAASCVSADLGDSENAASTENVGALIKEKMQKMHEIKEKMSEYKKSLWSTLALSTEQEEELRKNLTSLKRRTVDDVLTADHPIDEVNMEEGIADLLYQGDMIPPDEHLDQIIEIGGIRSKRQAQALFNEAHPEKWEHNISYKFQANLGKRVRSAFNKAARLWTVNTCINIKKLDEEDEEVIAVENGEGDYYDEDYGDGLVEDDDDDDEEEEEGEEEEEEQDMEPEEEQNYESTEAETIIIVSNINGCSSSTGKKTHDYLRDEKGRFKQFISLDRRCETIGTAAHELGHTLGFYHTQSRYDRDDYITVIGENINQNYSDQFDKQTNETNNNYGLPYDYGSVMHYRATDAALVKGNLTIVPKDVLYTETLGSPMIAYYDILMMNKHYNCTAKCEGKPNECNDGFPHPRNCSRCICPSGMPPGCGQELDATRNWSFIKNDPHNMTAGHQNGYKNCVYWIKAPNNTKIEVKIMDLPEGVAVDGCIYAGVEIKTKQDQRLTGYRFCSKDDIGIVLTSNVHTVPVFTYMRRRRNDTDIMLGYRHVPLDGSKVDN